MINQILKCTSCSKYTMEEICSCGGKAVSPKPAKFRPDDKYGFYRRLYKKKHLE
ncbi:MAG TPA: nucleolar RNA-binding Nop10p family protein [Candidatus Nanoarchaeia archaeon]|nr:nucleolar RNA-binding Nop10p family protein [Candidatus Nanoarchaeia archaeon]